MPNDDKRAACAKAATWNEVGPLNRGEFENQPSTRISD